MHGTLKLALPGLSELGLASDAWLPTSSGRPALCVYFCLFELMHGHQLARRAGRPLTCTYASASTRHATPPSARLVGVGKCCVYQNYAGGLGLPGPISDEIIAKYA